MFKDKHNTSDLPSGEVGMLLYSCCLLFALCGSFGRSFCCRCLCCRGFACCGKFCCGSVETACGSHGSCLDGSFCAKTCRIARFGHCEGGEDGQYYQSAYECPCGFLKEAVGLTDAHYCAGAAELRRQTAAFGFLNQYDADEKKGNDYCQNDYDNVHTFIIF